MGERPILFSGPMVRAILDGSKTVTRRVVDPPPDPETGRIYTGVYHPRLVDRHGEEYPGDPVFGAHTDDGWESWKCPYGAPGDRLWVRETHAIVPSTAYAMSTDDGVNPIPHRRSPDGDEWAVYREGWSRCKPGRWRPSIHMPRWASRITMEVTDVAVERVREITEEEARAEGAQVSAAFDGLRYQGWGTWRAHTEKGLPNGPRAAFAALWDSINAKRGFGWDENPWVWVVRFRVVRP